VERKGNAFTGITLIAISLISGCGDGGNSTTPPSTTPRSWSNAHLIEFSDVGTTATPQIAFDNSGNALAVWSQTGPIGAYTNIMASRYVTGSGWDLSPQAINNSGGHAQNPQIAFAANGNAVAVWQQHDGTRYNIWANDYQSGSGWQTARLVETDTGDARVPQITVIPGSGIAFAIWRQFDGVSLYHIWANRYVPGSGWETPQLLQSDTYDANTPQIAVDCNGNATAVWMQLDVSGTRNDIWSSRYQEGTGWLMAQTQTIESDTGSAQNPQLGIDITGNAIVIWEQFDGTRLNIQSNRYDTTTGWGTPEFVENNNTGPAYTPQIAVSADGSAMAIWSHYDGTRFNIQSNSYSPTTGWGTAVLMEKDDTGDALIPQISLASTGDAFAVWKQSDGNRYNIQANRYTSGTGWGTSELIEHDDTSDVVDPQIAVDKNGNALAIWIQNDGADIHDDTWVNRFK